MLTMRGVSRRRWMTRVGMAGLVTGLALACGSEPESTPSAAAPAAPAAAPEKPGAPSAPADAGAQARLEALYEWDPTAGAARDLSADTAACMSLLTAEGLPGVAEHIACMRSWGWKTLQPQS